MVYFSKRDPKLGGLVKIRTGEDKKQYALFTAIIQRYGNSKRIKETPAKRCVE